MMKKLSLVFFTVAVLGFIAACASAPAPAARTSDLPDFVINPPIATDAIYGVGYGRQSRPDLSLRVAETNARADIATQLETTIQSAVTAYLQEAGVDDQTQTISFAESITRQITDMTLSGATPQSRQQDSEGGWWVLMVYSKQALLDSFEDIAKSFERDEGAAFAEFKAAQALERLDHQLQNNPTRSQPVR